MAHYPGSRLTEIFDDDDDNDGRRRSCWWRRHNRFLLVFVFHSPIAKAREVAAKAKVSLVLAPSPQILTRIVNVLAGSSQNGLHGELLYILAHVKAAPVKNLSSLFMSMWELQDSVRFVWISFVPRTIWLEVLDYMLSTPNCVEVRQLPC